MMKKIWTVLLSICLILSLAAPSLAAPIKTSGAASTLKLESVDGTAQLKNASGKEVKATKGARLYNGYKLATEKASYAFVSLDDTKAIKLDASSSSEVFQSGKKLELKVTSGQMFFNVTAPLKSDETLNIRTSTMVTGVRGTSGWIEVVSRYITRVSLLEGELTITSVDPLTGVTRSVTISGGQTATVVHHGEGKDYESEIIVDGSTGTGGSGSGSAGGSASGSTSGTGSGSSSSSTGSNIIGTPEIGSDEVETIEKLIQGGVIREEHIVVDEPGLTVENLQEEDVPGFVAVEVKKDKELQKKIEENSPLSVPAIIGDAEERLEKEEAAAEAADKAIQEEFEKLTADDVDPLFGTSSGGSGGGGSSGGSAAAPTSAYLTNPTAKEVNDAFQTYNNVYVTGIITADTTDEENPVYDVNVPQGQTLYFHEASASINEDVTINGTGTITLNSPVVLDNLGTILVDSTNSLHVNSGATMNNQNIIIIGNSAAGAMTVAGAFNNDGTLYIGSNEAGGIADDPEAGGDSTNEPDSSPPADPDIPVDDIPEAVPLTSSSVTVYKGGVLKNNGTLAIEEGSALEVEVAGELSNQADSVITNSGEFTNSGTFTNRTGGIISNVGTITNGGTFSNANNTFSPVDNGFFYNDGTYTDTRTDDLYVMVENSDSLITAWGIAPQAQETADRTSPFYDANTGTETWLANHTYTLYGEQIVTENGPSPVAFPDVTAANVTLDLNDRLVDLGRNYITVTANENSTGNLTVCDLQGNGRLFSTTAETLLYVNGGSLKISGAHLLLSSNASGDTAAIKASSLQPLSEVSILGSSYVENQNGYGILAQDSVVQVESGTVTGTLGGIGFVDNGSVDPATFPAVGVTVTGGSVTATDGYGIDYGYRPHGTMTYFVTIVKQKFTDVYDSLDLNRDGTPDATPETSIQMVTGTGALRIYEEEES